MTHKFIVLKFWMVNNVLIFYLSLLMTQL